MTPERWKQIGELYQATLELQPDERAAFLGRACGDDEALRREVESLLAVDECAGGFLSGGAMKAAAKLLVEDEALSLIGKGLGHYQVLSLLGAGGMGEVYLAEDTRLSRPVALKLLPRHFSKDEGRLRRFEQEARAASVLNHPCVCMIYEVGVTVDDRHYIAMEYVDGVTLRRRIAHQRMKVIEALDVAVQVAAALTAAHASGVVHRDIKPENIMVRRDDYIKVLDFGLAKLTERGGDELATIPGPLVKTDTGVVLGTASYMSPEQARGLAVDARTDIWSLGVVLYEMVTGRVPFDGDTTSDMIVSILEREPPPLAQFSPRAPSELQRIIIKALRKDKAERYQAVTDLLLDLRSLKQDLELEDRLDHSLEPALSGRETFIIGAIDTAAPARLQRWWTSRLTGLAVVLALVAGGTLWFYFSRPASKTLTRPDSESSLPPMKTVPLTSFPGREEWPTFSPDGNQLAFMSNGEKGDNLDIYVKLIDAGAPLRLTTHPGIDNSPTWSPDGKYIAFTRFDKGESAIFIVPALGGPERKLLSLGFQVHWFGNYPPVVWSPDGKSLAFPDKGSPEDLPGIFLVSIETGERRRLTSPPAQYLGDWFPAFSPDGQTLVFTRSSSEGASDIYLIRAVGGEVRRLTFDNTWSIGPVWTPDGSSIVFISLRGGTLRLWKVSASGGTPELLAIGGETFMIQQSPSPLSISRQGNRLAFARSLEDVNIWRIEVSRSTGRGTSPTKVVSSTQYEGAPQFSPDGQKIVFQSERSGISEIWVCDLDGANPRQLTFFGGPLVGTPRWSPDGHHIAFDARPEGHSDIYVVGAEGGRPRRITTETSNDVVPSWSRDGRFIYFASNRTGARQVWKVPIEGGAARQVTKRGGFAAFESPDGKYLYYAKFDDPGLWRIPIEGGEESLLFDQLKPGDWGYWAVVERGIYFISPEAKPRATIEFFNFATRRITQTATLEKEPDMGLSVLAASPAGRWILYGQVDQRGSDIVMVENFR